LPENLQNAIYFCTFALGKLASWITREKHHEKPAITTLLKIFDLQKQLWKKNP